MSVTSDEWSPERSGEGREAFVHTHLIMQTGVKTNNSVESRKMT
jgi:hypothetical protein